MNRFEKLLNESQTFLTEGSMYDRLHRTVGKLFDPSLAHLGLIYSEAGREMLSRVYTDYIDVAKQYHFPIIVFTPTWRGNQERVAQSLYHSKNVNIEGASFLLELRSAHSSPAAPVIVGGLIGCKNDCYKPEDALSPEAAEAFHAPQIRDLACTDIDFLFASTLPAVSEALGIAQAMSRTGLPYILSFVTNRQGEVLDGTPLGEAVKSIDSSVSRPPLRYLVNCVHPEIFAEGYRNQVKLYPPLIERFGGIQGNTSKRSANELDSLEILETEAPESFARSVIMLKNEFKMQILGGCCGTGPEHIRCIAEQLQGEDISRLQSHA